MKIKFNFILIGLFSFLGEAWIVFQESLEMAIAQTIIEFIVFTLILVGIIVTAAHKIFALITVLPNRVPRWIGQQIQPFGEEQQEKQVSGIAVGGMQKVSRGTQKAGKIAASGSSGGGDGGGGEGDGGANPGINDSSFKSGQS